MPWRIVTVLHGGTAQAQLEHAKVVNGALANAFRGNTGESKIADVQAESTSMDTLLALVIDIHSPLRFQGLQRFMS